MNRIKQSGEAPDKLTVLFLGKGLGVDSDMTLSHFPERLEWL